MAIYGFIFFEVGRQKYTLTDCFFGDFAHRVYILG